MAKRAALMLLAIAAASIGPARAEDDPACAKYGDPLAYNACLASHGPKANAATSPRPDREGHETAAQPKPDGPRSTRSARRWPQAIRGHGRVHMEFLVK
jgi:hypothetical protein